MGFFLFILSRVFHISFLQEVFYEFEPLFEYPSNSSASTFFLGCKSQSWLIGDAPFRTLIIKMKYEVRKPDSVLFI